MTGLDRALGRLVEIVPHLRGSTVADGDGWTSGRTFLGHDPTDPLDVLLADDRTGRFAVDRPAYASAFYEGYAIRLLGTALGVWLLGEDLPDPSPEHTSFRVAVDLPSEIAFTGATGYALHEFVDVVLADHLDLLAERITDRVPIGRTLLFSNIASAVSTSGLAVVRAAGSGGLPDPGRTVEAFRAALPEHIASLGHWVPGPNWMRGACCLWFREDPSGAMCTLCPITERTDPA
ncbi:MAG: hypothetical protein ACHQDC_06775 [Acidimicrobiales bacterium]